MIRIERVNHRLTRKLMPARLSSLGVEGFEGYASVFNARDGIGDIVAVGALANFLRNRQLIDAGAAESVAAHLKGALDEIAKANAARDRVRGDILRDPASLRGDDGFRRD